MTNTQVVRNGKNGNCTQSDRKHSEKQKLTSVAFPSNTYNLNLMMMKHINLK